MCALFMVLFGQTASSQTTALKLNTSFILGLRQVGGFAIEYTPDSCALSVGLGLEFGNFESRQFEIGASQMDSRTVVGAGVSPHFRYYPFRKNRPSPHGFFIETNYRLRFVRETSITGAVISPLGYDLENAEVQSNNRWISDFSMAGGFKTGRGKRNMEFEFLGGIGYSPVLQESYYRVELFIAGIFNRKSRLGDDFFW